MGNQIFLSLFFSLIGAAYFIYGKKESVASFMLGGGILCFFPYVVSDALWMATTGVALMVIPFVVLHYWDL